MKPRNKFQQKAVEASKKLPPLTPAQERWAYTKVIESVGRRTKKGVVTCLDCGEVFHNDTEWKHCTCPACRTRLRIEDTRKQKFQQREYATYITACDAGRAGVYGELLYQSRTTAEPLLPRSHATVDSPRRQILHLRPEPGMGNDVLRPMDLFVRLGTARRIVGI